MKKIIGAIAAVALSLSVGVSSAAMAAEVPLTENLPPNAIVSEGNGAAVFIGYGGDATVSLSWRPSKQFESAKMLYQVQRSDGAMVVSKTSATSYSDKNLAPNTAFTYVLSAFQTTEKDVKIKKGKQKGKTVKKTTTKMVGQNTITVVTLPGEIVGLYNPDGKKRYIKWQPPAVQSSPITYNIYIDQNLWVNGYSNLDYTFPSDLFVDKKSARAEVCAVNESGEAKKCSSVTVPFGPAS